MSDKNTLFPDIETASTGYKTRFKGEIGEFFLKVQAETVMGLLPHADNHCLKILEVGGGHGQLVEHFLKAGHEVWVHGSDECSLDGISYLMEQHSNRLHFIASSMYELPFSDGFFDAVVGVRILAHVEDENRLLKEWLRVSSSRIIFDYPPLESFNFLYPVTFRIKKLFEGNTRTFRVYTTSHFKKIITSGNAQVCGLIRQFFLPMVFHRTIGNAQISEKIEAIFRNTGVTEMLGSPAVLAAGKLIAGKED